MLLTEMASNEEGHLAGRTEDGKEIPLSVPYPDAVVGEARFKGDKDLAMTVAERRLKMRARSDTGRYYHISEGKHTDDNKIFIIPYLTFIK